MNLEQAKEQIKFHQWEYSKLKDIQNEFQDELIKEVERINKMPPFKRWWNRTKLLFEVLKTIIEAVEKAKERQTNNKNSLEQ